MTIFDIVRNALLAGFGIQEKVREFVDDLVKKGELSESQGAKLVREWIETADKSTFELSKTLSDVVTKTIEKIALPSKEDVEGLERKVQELSVRIAKIEEIVGERKGQ